MYLLFYINFLNILCVLGDDVFDFADTRAYSNQIVTELCKILEETKFERVLAPPVEARKNILKCIWVFTSRSKVTNGFWGTSCSRTEIWPPNYAELTSNDTNGKAGRAGIKPGPKGEKRWPRGVLVYQLNSKKFTNEELTYIAIALWEVRYASSNCLTFRLKGPEDEDYVVLLKGGDSCESAVGRQGGPQELYLGKRCLVPQIITHELIHAYGFYHEHSRPDRDKYVEIVWKNVVKGTEINFEIINDTITYEEEYDYRSIMHYARDAFSNNKEDTIVPIDPSNKLPFGGPIITQKDRLRLVKMYCKVYESRMVPI